MVDCTVSSQEENQNDRKLDSVPYSISGSENNKQLKRNTLKRYVDTTQPLLSLVVPNGKQVVKTE